MPLPPVILLSSNSPILPMLLALHSVLAHGFLPKTV
jgi:hypothetical protein